MRRQLMATLVTSGVVLGSMVAGAPVASATTIEKIGYVRDSGCAGRMIDQKTIYGDWTRQKFGQVQLFYPPRNGGENCVITRSWVGKAEMSASLLVDKDGNKPGLAGKRFSSDYGKYSSYAGGAYRTGTNGHCVKFHGVIWKSGEPGIGESNYGHCG